MSNYPLHIIETKAWNFAKEKHNGQLRKFTNKPYFDEHVAKVNGIVKLYTKNPKLLAGALLHDVIEDCYDDIENGIDDIHFHFGKEILNLVLQVTSNDAKLKKFESKGHYLLDKMINMCEDSLIIKLSDRLQNIDDLFTVQDKFKRKYTLETDLIISGLITTSSLNIKKFNRIHYILLNNLEYKVNNTKKIFQIN